MSKQQRAALEAALARFEWLEDQPHVRGKDDCYEDIIGELHAALAEEDSTAHALLADLVVWGEAGSCDVYDLAKAAGEYLTHAEPDWREKYIEGDDDE